MKLLRTIRLDPSDTFVFDHAAEPGEWAVTGAFMFADDDPAKLEGKARAAFRSGFLGVASLGWSTLVQIVEASDDDRLAAIDTLAKQLVAHFGAPSIEDAVAAAEEEFEFAASLCNHPLDTLIAMHRSHEAAKSARRSAPCVPRTGRSRCAPSPSSKWKARTSRRMRSIWRRWRRIRRATSNSRASCLRRRAMTAEADGTHTPP